MYHSRLRIPPPASLPLSHDPVVVDEDDLTGEVTNAADRVQRLEGLCIPDVMKDVWVDLPQDYESQPGTVIGSYVVRRLMSSTGNPSLQKRRR